MELNKKKRVLTGSRPSGTVHLGNYLGPFREIIAMQKDFEVFFFLADLHAFDVLPSKEELRERSYTLTATMLAAGLDPKHNFLYAQSSVPQTTELMWYLSCIAPFGMLTRAVAFKDAQAKNIDINAGIFSYPVLMAADILLYDPDVIPVGKDQSQHVEIARDLAARFNNHFGSLLKIPDLLVREDVGLLPGTDGTKMSSSKGNVIPVFATDKEWKKTIMGIVTDSKGLDDSKNPDTCTIFKLYSTIAKGDQIAQMREDYVKGQGYGYGHAKLALLDAVKEHFSAMRDSYFDWLKRKGDLDDVLKLGSIRARELAEKKLALIQDACGFIGRSLF